MMRQIHGSAVDIKEGKLVGAELTGFRSYRFMRYRIVYKVVPAKEIVVVWAVGHRRDIYENFSDQLVGKR